MDNRVCLKTLVVGKYLPDPPSRVRRRRCYGASLQEIRKEFPHFAVFEETGVGSISSKNFPVFMNT